MFIVRDNTTNYAIIFYDKSYVESLGLEYFEVESIPDGHGVLKTDGKTLWWEEILPEKATEEEIQQKYNLISKACEDTIHNGFQLETTVGVETFSLTDQDQSNLTTAANAIQNGATKYLYHANKTLCRVYTAQEIKAIADAAVAHTIYHTTYCNHMFRWLDRIETKEELDKVYYGAELPEDLATHMQTIIEESELLNESTVALNEETRVYSIIPTA